MNACPDIFFLVLERKGNFYNQKKGEENNARFYAHSTHCVLNLYHGFYVSKPKMYLYLDNTARRELARQAQEFSEYQRAKLNSILLQMRMFIWMFVSLNG